MQVSSGQSNRVVAMPRAHHNNGTQHYLNLQNNIK